MKKFFSFLPVASLLFTLACTSSCAGQDALGPQVFGEVVSSLDETIYIVFQDANKNYWFGSNGNGVYRYDGKTIVHFTTKDGLCHPQIRQIQEDKSGNIFFTTTAGISKFDGQKFTTLPVVKSKEWKLGPDDLWFTGLSGENGPCRYDGKTLYQLEFPKHYLADEFYELYPSAGYSPYDIYTIYKDSKGVVWFGTSNFGVCRFDGTTLSWMYEKHLTETPQGGQFCIRSIFEDKAGKFWICNTSYRYKMFPTSTAKEDRTLIDYEREAGINTIEPEDGLGLIYFMSIVEDNQGDLWMASYDQGVWRYDGKNTTRYRIMDGSKELTLFSIYKDLQGDIWLGTHEKGVYKFNSSTFEKFVL